MKELRKEIKNLGKKDMEGGGKEKQLAKLRHLFDHQSSQNERTESPHDPQLKREIDAAKAKKSELTDKIRQKKHELNTIMSKPPLRLGQLGEQENETRRSVESEGTLRERLSKLSSLRGLIADEIKERDRLSHEIKRLKKRKSSEEISRFHETEFEESEGELSDDQNETTATLEDSENEGKKSNDRKSKGRGVKSRNLKQKKSGREGNVNGVEDTSPPRTRHHRAHRKKVEVGTLNDYTEKITSDSKSKKYLKDNEQFETQTDRDGLAETNDNLVGDVEESDIDDLNSES